MSLYVPTIETLPIWSPEFSYMMRWTACTQKNILCFYNYAPPPVSIPCSCTMSRRLQQLWHEAYHSTVHDIVFDHILGKQSVLEGDTQQLCRRLINQHLPQNYMSLSLSQSYILSWSVTWPRANACYSMNLILHPIQLAVRTSVQQGAPDHERRSTYLAPTPTGPPRHSLMQSGIICKRLQPPRHYVCQSMFLTSHVPAIVSRHLSPGRKYVIISFR